MVSGIVVVCPSPGWGRTNKVKAKKAVQYNRFLNISDEKSFRSDLKITFKLLKYSEVDNDEISSYQVRVKLSLFN